MRYTIKSNSEAGSRKTEPTQVAEPRGQKKPARFGVEVFITDPWTERPLVSQVSHCQTLQEAQAMLVNVQDLLDQLSEYLGGLGVMAYETLGEGEEVISITPSGLDALAAALPAERRNTEWWAKAAGQE